MRCVSRAVAWWMGLGLLTLQVVAGEAPAPAPEAEDAWPAFVVEWPREAAGSPADLSGLSPAPAGKDGFVGVRDGHLADGAGRRLKLWGVNATTGGALPARESAPVVAAHLARLGVNAVRFHFIDLPAPAGLIDPRRDDTQHFDAGQLDRLDFFVAALKERGIYTNLNLHVGRRYKPGDGVRDAELLGLTKAVTYFDERIVELQKEHARALLTHVNPYTGKAYRDEPAVALVELLNENSLVEAWAQGRLLGQQTTPTTETWHDIPPSYERALTEQYNRWLAENVPAGTLAAWRAALGLAAGAPIPRLAPREFATADAGRFRAEARFYMHVERRFFEDMGAFLRNEVRVRVPVIGNSDHGHGMACYALTDSLTVLDALDGHVYWQHPHYGRDAAGRRTFSIPNTAMVDDPLHSTVAQLARSAVAGRPYTVSEVNHPFPAEHAAEGVPILAAYAALHDWDAIFWYSLSHRDVLALDARVGGHFDLAYDPVKMSQLAAGALMFRRGDVSAARRTVGRSYSPQQVIDAMRLPWRERPFFTPGFPPATSLVHATRIESLRGEPTGRYEEVAATDGAYRSDTGQLAWYARGGSRAGGAVVIDSPLSQALVGHVTEDLRCANLAARPEARFCALTLSSLDGRPIAASRRMLLTVGARVRNTGMRWDAKRTTLEDWGKPPTRIEPVGGTVSFPGLVDGTALRAQPLDGAGRPMGEAIEVRPGADGAPRLPLGAPTTWYVLTRGD